MATIDKKYINQGIELRKEFLGLNSQMDVILKDLKKVAENLKNENDNLEDINSNLKEMEYEQASRLVLEKLMNMELEAEKLHKIYEPINKRIEEIKKQETILFENVKMSYPSLSEEEIFNQFSEHLSKLK